MTGASADRSKFVVTDVTPIPDRDPGLAKLRTTVSSLRQQIAEVERHGADDNDLCVAMPPSYLTVVLNSAPTLLVEQADGGGAEIALVSKVWAKAFIIGAEAEAGL